MKMISLLILCLILLAPSVPAASIWGPAEIDTTITTGVVTASWTGFERDNRTVSPFKLWEITWTSNPSGDCQFATDQIQGEVLWMATKPDDGASSPTDNYDITITSAGIDLLGGSGQNRDIANTEYIYAFGPGSGNVGHPVLVGECDFIVDAAGDTRSGTWLLAIKEE